MCGTLVLTFGQRLAAPSRSAQLRYALLHHLGRVVTYVTLALPAGLLGETLLLRQMGRALAVTAGAALLLAALGSVRVRGFSRIGGAVSSAVVRLSSPIVRIASGRPLIGPLLTGVMNGLLPCGLVYAAVVAAAGLGSLRGAMLLMAGFGAGTAPVLVAIACGAAAVPAVLRLRLRALGPIALAVTALILISRGVGEPHHMAPASGHAMHMHP
jgi:sulfite exporter TauE/SafE